MSSIHYGSAFAESSSSSPDSVEPGWSPTTSVHERLTVAEIQGDVPAVATDASVTTPNGWLTFEAYVAWIAAMNGVASTALTTPAAESERSIEDRRSTVIVPSRRMRRKPAPKRLGMAPSMPRRHRLSATVIRRVLAKTG